MIVINSKILIIDNKKNILLIEFLITKWEYAWVII
jgi:hypothetical protein